MSMPADTTCAELKQQLVLRFRRMIIPKEVGAGRGGDGGEGGGGASTIRSGGGGGGAAAAAAVPIMVANNDAVSGSDTGSTNSEAGNGRVGDAGSGGGATDEAPAAEASDDAGGATHTDGDDDAPAAAGMVTDTDFDVAAAAAATRAATEASLVAEAEAATAAEAASAAAATVAATAAAAASVAQFGAAFVLKRVHGKFHTNVTEVVDDGSSLALANGDLIYLEFLDGREVGDNLDLAALTEHHQDAASMAAFEAAVRNGEVGGGSSRSRNAPLSLEDCMRLFKEPEVLAESNSWFCSRCTDCVCMHAFIDDTY